MRMSFQLIIPDPLKCVILSVIEDTKYLCSYLDFTKLEDSDITDL